MAQIKKGFNSVSAITKLCVSSSVLCCLLITVGYTFAVVNNKSHNVDIILHVESGDGLLTVSNKIMSAGLLEKRWPLMVWSYLTGSSKSLKAGEYKVSSDVSPRQLIDNITNGKVYLRTVTINEGLNFNQVVKKLKNTGTLINGDDNYRVDKLLSSLNIDRSSPEGLFFPDTYYFESGSTSMSILKIAYLKMREELDRAWSNRSNEIALNNSYEALILASIIQKEAMKNHEMDRISAVFHNRLKKGMRLQADPTVIYGLGNKLKGELKKSHLKMDNPYNTYRRNGLPPTPICMPGLAAIHAALNPRNSNEYYFVAKGDGTHRFSSTLEQHNKAVKKYRNNK